MQFAAIRGEVGDATAFNDMVNVKRISDMLKEYGYQQCGNEILYNGFTGRKLRSQVRLNGESLD